MHTHIPISLPSCASLPSSISHPSRSSQSIELISLCYAAVKGKKLYLQHKVWVPTLLLPITNCVDLVISDSPIGMGSAKKVIKIITGEIQIKFLEQDTTDSEFSAGWGVGWGEWPFFIWLLNFLASSQTLCLRQLPRYLHPSASPGVSCRYYDGDNDDEVSLAPHSIPASKTDPAAGA